MDKKKNKKIRKSREVGNKLDEENLWDLEDEWEDEDPTSTEDSLDDLEQGSLIPSEAEATDTSDADKSYDETGLLDSEQASEAAASDEPIPEIPSGPMPIETEDQDERIEEPPSEAAKVNELEDSEDTLEGKDSEEEGVPTGITAPATVIMKKLSLNKTEKIALGILATAMLGFCIWGAIWLHGKNKIANAREQVELPAEGKHATITELSTFWISPKRNTGVNLDATLVPAITISLDEGKSSSGALRLIFRDAEDISVGDTITLPFNSGSFSNGKNTIEVSASNGFRREADFHAYQVDDGIPWRIQILEASDPNASGDDFEELLSAPVEAKRR